MVNEESGSSAREAMAMDFDLLAETSGGDPDFERDLLTDLIAQCERMLGTIEQAVASADADALCRAGHNMKGCCGTIGAMALSAIGAVLERLGAEGRLAEAEATVARARDALARTRSMIVAYLETGARRAG